MISDASPEEQAGEGNMPYNIIGEDQQNTLEKLEKYTGVVDWSYLIGPYKNDALLWVDPDLELTVVGKAIADDDKEAVQRWMKKGDLIKPGELHAAQWADGEWYFKALVVSPFVLAQPANKED